MTQVIGSAVGSETSAGYMSVELDAGETSDPFVVQVEGGSEFKSFGPSLVLVEARVDSVGSWADLSLGLDLTGYSEVVNVQLRLTAGLIFEGYVIVPIFVGNVVSSSAGWLG